MDTQAEAARKEGARTITVKGQQLRIDIRPGKGTSTTPLLLMNGIGVNLELLQPFVDALAPAIPYRFSTLAWLVAQVLNQLGYKQADVLGISWGGGLAQQFAFQHSKRCRRLVLVSTGTGATMIPGRLSVLAKLATPWRYMEPSYLAAIASDLYGGNLRSNPKFVREVARAMHSDEPIGYFYQLWAGMGWSSLPWLKFLRQPTLILAGNDDPIVPLINAKIMQHLIPYSKLHVYNGGHLGLLTNAQELAHLIEQFLAGEMRNARGD